MDADTLATAAAHAAIVVAVTAAIRARVAVDGWHVLVLAAVVALAIAAAFVPAYDLPTLVEGVRGAVLSWVLAVGGDAWVSKIATRGQARINTILTSTIDDALRPTEPPAAREDPDQ